MSATGTCCDTCPTPVTVQVPGPAGFPGTNGTNGANGTNAFTLTSAGFTVPNIGINVTVPVLNSTWMGIGQNIFIPGAGYFQVVTVPSSTSVQLNYLNYQFNTFAMAAIPASTIVSPGGLQPPAPTLPAVNPIAAYASGAGYNLTASDSPVVFGTTQPAITITTAGTWRISGQVKISYVGATFSAVRTVTLKLRRTSPSPSDIANTVIAFATQIITSQTSTAAIFSLPSVSYVTAGVSDAITINGLIDVVPSAGTITIDAANVFAEYIHA